MREKGLLKRGDIFEQRQWFKDNPQRVREILNENPSYVFFRYGSRGPTGAMGHVVDEWLSLAVDRSYIPLGAVVAFVVNVPDEKYGRSASGRSVLPWTGGAIKQRRIDLFCGGSERATTWPAIRLFPGPGLGAEGGTVGSGERLLRGEGPRSRAAMPALPPSANGHGAPSGKKGAAPPPPQNRSYESLSGKSPSLTDGQWMFLHPRMSLVIFAALVMGVRAEKTENTGRIVFFTPRGRRETQKKAYCRICGAI